MLASFAEAAAILTAPTTKEVGKRNARFVLDNLRRDGLLLRTYKEARRSSMHTSKTTRST